MVSYYEWLQNKRSERWELEEVEQRLEHRMKRTYAHGAASYARDQKLDWRTAAYAIGLRAHRAGLLGARHLPVAGQSGYVQSGYVQSGRTVDGSLTGA